MDNPKANGSLTGVVQKLIDVNEPASPAVGENSEIMINPSDEKWEANQAVEKGENDSSENADNQMVLYDPTVPVKGETVPVAGVVTDAVPLRRHPIPHQSPRVLPSVGAFTVQCATCFKWRLIPTKEKYEEIREFILENPFICEAAREWRPDVSCDDDPDIVQDGTRLWAIDKPSIARPPPGWQRLLRIRAEGSTKFADVYYESPLGKRFRSMNEIQRFLEEHPEHKEQGVTAEKFSFQIPRPLQDNYVRKKVKLSPSLVENAQEGKPIAWPGPNEDLDLNVGVPKLPAYVDPVPMSAGPPRKKKSASKKSTNGGDSVGSSTKVKGETP